MSATVNYEKVPEKLRSDGKSTREKYPFSEMQVGGNMLLPDTEVSRRMVYRKRKELAFWLYMEREADGLRVYRLNDDGTSPWEA